MKKNNVNRGSEWRKWDLHLHSFGTKVNNQFGDDEDEYLQKLLDCDISVFGITDYFSADTQFETIKKFKTKFPESDKQFFVNIEFRLNENVSANSSGHVNAHLIFDNKLPEKKVKDFVSSLELTETNEDKTYKKISDLVSEVDFQRATIKKEEIQEKLEKSFGNDERYLLVMASGGLGGIRPNIDRQSGSLRNGPLSDELDKLAKFFFGDVQSRDYYLNNPTERYKNAVKRAIVKESDAHRIDKLSESNGIGDGYSWIKADTTFEGLQQILFEPEDRVSLQESCPEIKNDYQVIDKVIITQNDIEETLPFNAKLNTIIGGRSNGKSTLSNSIARVLENTNFEEWNEQTESGMFSFNGNSKLQVIWRDNQKNKGEEGKRDVEFLPQNYMIKIAENKESRNKHIENIVKSDLENYKKIVDYDAAVDSLQEKVGGLLREWSNIKNELSNLDVPEGDKKGIESQLSKLEDQLIVQQKKVNFSDEDRQAYQIKANELSSYQSKKEKYYENIKSIELLTDEEIVLEVNISGLSTEFQSELQEFLSIQQRKINVEWNSKLLELEKSLKLKRDNEQEEIDKIINSEQYTKGKQNIDSNVVLSQITGQITDQKSKLNQFIKFEKKQAELNKIVKEKEKEIIELYKKLKEYRETLINNFNVKSNSVEIALEFIQIPFKDNILYLRENTSNNSFIDSFNEEIDVIINNIFSNKDLVYNKQKNQDDLVKDILNTQWFKRNFILKYEEDDFVNMSQGKKAFVILTLILEFSKDKKPVIIDQPEDSLDNKAIYKQLTRYLKSKKIERQIILVTHNPNIVVGADAENVIVANMHSVNEPNPNSMKFHYINGSLESSVKKNKSKMFLDSEGIREHVIEILEGGNEAFTKREQKYTTKHNSNN